MGQVRERQRSTGAVSRCTSCPAHYRSRYLWGCCAHLPVKKATSMGVFFGVARDEHRARHVAGDEVWIAPGHQAKERQRFFGVTVLVPVHVHVGLHLAFDIAVQARASRDRAKERRSFPRDARDCLPRPWRSSRGRRSGLPSPAVSGRADRRRCVGTYRPSATESPPSMNEIDRKARPMRPCLHAPAGRRTYLTGASATIGSTCECRSCRSPRARRQQRSFR